MFTRILPLFLFLALFTIGLTGCGGAEADPGTDVVSSITITPVGNMMEFEQTAFPVKAGA
jgi:hypothetical protein